MTALISGSGNHRYIRRASDLKLVLNLLQKAAYYLIVKPVKREALGIHLGAGGSQCPLSCGLLKAT